MNSVCRVCRSIALLLFVVSASLVAGCGGSSAKPQPGTGCAINSDCSSPLICTFAICHVACTKQSDCGAGELCVVSATGNSCQKEPICVYNSDCSSPLVCARDEQCRNMCQTSVDCPAGQVCTDSKVCALSSQLVSGTNDIPIVTTGLDGGAGGSHGGAGGGAAGTGGAGGGAAGTNGTAGAGGGGGSGTICTPACGPGKQCVSGTCQTCGGSAQVCCGTTCGTNLTCSTTGMCTCGDANQACCGGSTCNSGLSCVGGTCSCGGAGQSCCPGKTCTGSLVCGGLRCGCTTACDENALLKNDGSIFVNSTPITNNDASLFKVTSFSYNGTIACGVKPDATVWCWGSNTYGALGNGDTTITTSAVPIQVVTAVAGPALAGITSVVVGETGYNVCAVGAAGAVWCWGYGGYGQLGNGFKNNSSFAIPVVVDASSAAFTGVKQISASYYHVCVLKTDSTVWCWGDNTYGEIGTGSSAATVLYPAQVTALFATGTSIVAGVPYYESTCASTADGSAYCWGFNGYGDLGNGLMSGMANVPSQVLVAAATPLPNVAKVVDWEGQYKMCALKTDGTMWCWGTPSALYAAPLTDNSTMQVTGVNIVGRECYTDANDAVWVNGAKASNAPTCP